MAGKNHRRAARSGDHCGPPVCAKRRQNARQVDDHHRRSDEPLVSQRHELSRRDQHAHDVRLHRPIRWRLGTLRRSGKAASADRLASPRVCARLDSSATTDEQHQLFLRTHRSVALRKTGDGRGALAAGRQEQVRRQHDRLQRTRRAHGLAAFSAANAHQSDAVGQGRASGRAGAERLCGQRTQGRKRRDELHRSRSPQ